MTVINALKVEIEGKEYTIVGDDFYSMLARVKDIQGRQWGEPLGKGKVWVLPGTLSEIGEILSPLEVLADEDEVLNKELEEIAKIQKYVLDNERAISEESDNLGRQARSYSFNSKSRFKAAHLRNSGMLSHAIDYAKLPIEELSAPQIATLKAAVRYMEGE
jgi:hypothetical protein